MVVVLFGMRHSKYVKTNTIASITKRIIICIIFYFYMHKYIFVILGSSSHGCPSRNKTNSKSSISTYSSKVVPVPPKLPNEVTNNQEDDDEFVGNDIWSVNSLSSRVKNLNWNDEANSVFKKVIRF